MHTLPAHHPDRPTASQRLLQALQQARARLEDVERQKHEPIAIVGMGCRFPGGASNPEAYWRLLYDGVDAIGEVPPGRWDVDAYYDEDPDAPGKMYTRHGGFLEEVDTFDPSFFGISPREAACMDPQQRLLLEVSWEALEHAGQAPARLRGSRTGVFVGISFDDYARLSVHSGDPTRIDAYSSLGNARSIAVGRLSYVLGLQGPTMQLDTTCSSSLLAIHLACQSLRAGESDLALAGGVNLMLSPEVTIGFCKLKALAPDGRCKTFDAAADGYARGEGCGIVVLKRLSDAVADGDNILVLVRGSAVNHDGQSNGLTAPNGAAQEAVIRQALDNARVAPADIQYVEAHGTGTTLGDPIEVLALAKVLKEGRAAGDPLAIGSVKSNFGHLESAAGVAGVMKVVLALQQGILPPHLHFKAPNPYIPWGRLPVTVPTEAIPWPSNGQPRRAGVSSFGMSGTNVHLILEEAPAAKPAPAAAERPCHVLSLSAVDEAALRALAGRYEAFLAAHPEAGLAAVCGSANTGRSHFDHRLAVVAESPARLCEPLAAFAAGQKAAGLISGRVTNRQRPKVAFLFTGQGAQYPHMAGQLYQTEPAFRRVLDRADEILRPHLERPLLDVLYPGDPERTPLHETAFTQPALFAVEYALAALWQSWGVVPSVVMGHSVGEYVAACVAGVFSLEDGLRLIAARGRLMQSLPSGGQMVAVFAGEARVAAAVEAYPGVVSIAAVNGPENVVLSGEGSAVAEIVSALEAEGIKTRQLNVSHAFHSPLMAPILDDFERVASSVSYVSPTLKIVSNVTGALIQDEIAHAAYWRRHIAAPVHFARGMAAAAREGSDVYLEIGPKPTLVALGRTCVSREEALWLPSLRQGQADWQTLLQSLGHLYARGVPVDWAGVDGAYYGRRIPLPTYPFQRKSYWLDVPRVDRTGPRSVSVTPALEGAHPAHEQGETAAPEGNAVLTEAQIREAVFALIAGHCSVGAAGLHELKHKTLDEIGYDSLMKTSLRSQMLGLHPKLNNHMLPMSLFLGRRSIAEIIDTTLAIIGEIRLDQEAFGQPHRAAHDESGLPEAVFATCRSWSEDFEPGVVARVDRKLVHKDHQQNVLLARIDKLGDDLFIAEMNQDLSHTFFYEHPKDHVTSMYLLEAVMQMGRAVPHLYYDVSVNTAFVINEIESKFHRFAEVNQPVFLVARVKDKVYAEGALTHLHTRCYLIQHEEIIGWIDGLGQFIDKQIYANLRNIAA